METKFPIVKKSINKANRLSKWGMIPSIIAWITGIILIVLWSIEFVNKWERPVVWNWLIVFAVITGVFAIISIIIKMFVALEIYGINRYYRKLNSEENQKYWEIEKNYGRLFWYVIIAILPVFIIDIVARVQIHKQNKQINQEN